MNQVVLMTHKMLDNLKCWLKLVLLDKCVIEHDCDSLLPKIPGVSKLL